MRSNQWKARAAAAALAVAVIGPGVAAAATPEPGSVETVVEFDGSSFELPESLTIDKQSNIYVSFALTGEIRKIAPDGSQSTVAVLDKASGFMTGLKIDSTGDIYVAVASFEATSHGVWRVDRTGLVEQIASLPTSTLPNDLAFDSQGRVYVTDSLGAAVWRIERDGAAGIWLEDELLRGRRLDGDPIPFPVGANGIAFDKGDLYIANTTFSRIVRVPLEADGTPGTPVVHVEADLLGGPDGIAVDIDGNVYVTNALSGGIFIVADDGSIENLVSASVVDDPSSIAFGTSGGDQRSLFVTNFAFFTHDNPAVLEVFVGTPGRPAH